MTFRFLLIFGLLTTSSVALAQSAAKPETPPQSHAQPDTKRDVNTQKDSEKLRTKQSSETFDLDKFFEDGARQAKDGASCQKPPEPIA